MLDYRGKMILAPMVKIGTTPTRILALEYGADIVYTEEIIDWRLIKATRIENKTLKTVDYFDEKDETLLLRISSQERGHLVLQIGTSDAERAVIVARKVYKDVDGIDVNMGCPKAFSLKGGMGASLLSHPIKIHKILTALVQAVGQFIPVTCKIRILNDLHQTLELVKMIQETGVAALAVHGRTKDERSSFANHTDFIREIKKIAKIPIIANGGSSNNRKAFANTHEGLRQFWKESEADSVMVARAAEWNVSVFRPQGLDDIETVISKYLDIAIEIDYCFIVVKYNVQQILGSLQETERGKRFLSTSTMKDLCRIFDKEDLYINRQEYLATMSTRRSGTGYGEGFSRNALRSGFSSLLPTESKKRKYSNSEDDVTEMYVPFIRGHYSKIFPKSILHDWFIQTKKSTSDRDQNQNRPIYETKQIERFFISVVKLGTFGNYSSVAPEKNRRFSEQAAASVALISLGIKCNITESEGQKSEETEEEKDRKIRIESKESR